jgi:GTP-binding protein
MEINGAKFITSITGNMDFPGKGLPEIAAAGKSNVGKSTFINCVCNNRKLARVSQEPGKTRLINIYDCKDFHLVDLPGYGFARAPGHIKQTWGKMMEDYLGNSRQLCHVFQLVDLRHPPTQDDMLMVNYLRHFEIPFTVVATKADKISRSQRARYVNQICRGIAVQPWEIILFSGTDRTGREDVLEKIEIILSNA